jgi:hypothetical protein
MPRIVFVVPYALEATLRFVRAAAKLPGVELAVVSQEPPGRLPDDVRARVASHRVVRDPLDPAQLESAVRSIGADWGGRVDRLIGILEQLQEPMATVRERLQIRGMDLAEAKNFRDKSRMKDVLRAKGLPCARHRLADSPDSALAFARECLPLVVKPPAGAGARNTLRVESLEDLKGYLRTVQPTPRDPLLLEEFIQGREHSLDSVTVQGRHVFHSISRYHPSPLEVIENPWLQWCVVLPREIDGPEFDDIRLAGRRALDALGMVTGLTHMEWFRRHDGSLAISEVAARPPGAQFTSLLSFAHDMDFYRAWAHLMVSEEFEPPARRWAVGAVFLRGQGSGKVVAVHGVEEARRELASLIVQVHVPRPGQPQSQSYEGEGYVILRHAETAEVEAGLNRVLQLIRVELGS